MEVGETQPYRTPGRENASLASCGGRRGNDCGGGRGGEKANDLFAADSHAAAGCSHYERDKRRQMIVLGQGTNVGYVRRRNAVAEKAI